jgi:hypothetical protein
MQNMMAAFDCEGAILAFARGNKNFGDVDHAEEIAAMSLQYQLATLPVMRRQLGTLVSCCQAPPCRGNRPPHNCQLLLQQMRALWLPGGALLPLVALWPPDFDPLVMAEFNRQWGTIRGRQMPDPWRAHDQARYNRTARALRGY